MNTLARHFVAAGVAGAFLLCGGCRARLAEVPPLPPKDLLAEVPRELKIEIRPEAVKAAEYVRVAVQANERARQAEGSSMVPDLGDLLEGLLTNTDPSAPNYKPRLTQMMQVRLPSLELMEKALAVETWSIDPPNPAILADPVPLYRNPGNIRVFGRLFPLLRGFEGSAELKRLRREPGMAKDLLKALAIGERLCGGGYGIHHLAGLRQEAVALRTIQSFASRPDVPDAELEALLAGVRDRPDAARLLTTYKHEITEYIPAYLSSVPLGGVTIGGPDGQRPGEAEDEEKSLVALLQGHPNPFDRLKTMRLIVNAYREMARRVSAPWVESRGPLGIERVNLPLPVDTEEIGFEEERKRILQIENVFGRHLLEEIVPISKQLGEFERRSTADVRSTRLILAIELYRRKFGDRPRNLNELVKVGLLSKVPVDPFQQQPFVISDNRRTLLSGGPDAKAKQRGCLGWPIDGRYRVPRLLPARPFNPPPPSSISPGSIAPAPNRQSQPSLNLGGPSAEQRVPWRG